MIQLGASCPVGMAAQQASLGQTMWTISLEDTRQPRNEAAVRASNSGVHVELTAANGKPIHQVELAVYFLAPGTRLLLVAPPSGQPDGQSASHGASDLQKTFHLAASGNASFDLAGDLLIGPAASITRVHLLRIDYTDGTSWQPSGSGVCSVEPNRFIPVGDR